MQLRVLAAFSFFGLLLAAHGRAMQAPAGPDAKGRDPALMAREDSLRSLGQRKHEAAALEDRREFLRSLRLPASASECVAYDPGLDSCLVTVGDFNRETAAWSFPAIDSLMGMARDTVLAFARGALLRSLLADPFLEYRISRNGKADSLAAAARRHARQGAEEIRRALGDSTLQRMYRDHYGELFRGRETRSIEGLAASDSTLADSLWRAFSGPEAGVPDRKPPAELWRWHPVEPADLPPEASAMVAKLRAGEVSGPIRTPYGFLLLRWRTLRKIPEIPYEDAIPILAVLSGDPAKEAALFQSRLEAYYREHRRELRSPDTAVLRVWLVPDPRHARRAFSAKVEAKVEAKTGGSPAQPHADTARASREAGYWDLPRGVRRKLARYLPLRPGDFLGPLQSTFGTWYVRTTGVKAGGRSLSMEEARPAILAALYGEVSATPADRIRALARTREKESWRFMAWNHAVETFAAANAEDAPGKAMETESASIPGLLQDKESWMRKRLAVRFVELGGIP